MHATVAALWRQADECTYPDWWQLVAELRASGVRTLSYINPFLTAATVASPCRPNRSSLFAEAAARGYLIVSRLFTVGMKTYFRHLGSM